jgi:DNA-binding MarR family transcriptional regulator
VVLQLTAAGRARADKIGGTVEAEVERMLARTPPEQIASTREVLNRLTVLLQQDDAPSRG